MCETLMATYKVSSMFLWFLQRVSLLCVCHLCSSNADQLSHTHIVSVSSLLPPTVCNRTTLSPAVSGKATLEVFSKYGPCATLNQGKSNTAPSLEEILRRDQLRVDLKNSRLFQNSNSDYLKQKKAISIPAKIKESTADEYYIVVALGEPKQHVSLLLDTGSDMTWTQCKPCVRCFQQRDPVFDPTKSKTYSNLPCYSPKCNILGIIGNNQACSSKKCTYTISYAEGTYSNGFFSTERLTLENGVKSLFVNNYMFGCANNNTGDRSDASGIMGLDRSPVSFITQTSQKYFSYCLPSWYSSTGYITFGKTDDIKNKFIKFTPITTTSQQSEFYDILITGISVGGKKLPIQSWVFTKPPTYIDSGTVITRLPQSAYSALRSQFRKRMMNYKMIKPVEILDTCYNLSSYHTVTIPKITFHFLGRVEFNMDVRGILVVVPDAEVACLAFAPNSDDRSPIYFGNVQQRGYEWHYDVAGRRLGFGPGSCS